MKSPDQNCKYDSRISCMVSGQLNSGSIDTAKVFYFDQSCMV